MAKSVTDQINKIMDDYGSKLNDSIRDIAVDVGKKTANDLKKTSPKSKGRGSTKGKHYANGWTEEHENIPGGGINVIVRNKYAWRLTHLLEKGHVIKNQYGQYGRAPAIRHIAPAEERGASEFLRRLENEL